jgi:hypothetical protein
MSAKTYIVDSGNTTRRIKKWWVIDSGGVARNLKKVWVIDAGGVARLVFQSASIFTMTASHFSGQGGYVQGVEGSMTPLGGGPDGLMINGNQLIQLDSTFPGGANLILVIQQAGGGPAPSTKTYLTSMVLQQAGQAAVTFTGASATSFGYSAPQGQWEWSSGFGFPIGTTFTVTLTTTS